jgi:alpha-tubulin suppressor-like RCC1 family protein
MASQGIPGAQQVASADATTVVSAAGQFHAHALKADGTVVRWGSLLGSNLTPEAIPAFGGVVAIAAGAAHSLALKADGTV